VSRSRAGASGLTSLPQSRPSADRGRVPGRCGARRTKPAEFDDVGRRQGSGPLRCRRCGGSHGSERWRANSVEHPLVADIACVENEIAPTERRNGLRPEQSVRVGNHAEVKVDFAHPDSEPSFEAPLSHRIRPSLGPTIKPGLHGLGYCVDLLVGGKTAERLL
jgi:hypothetical protein